MFSEVKCAIYILVARFVQNVPPMNLVQVRSTLSRKVFVDPQAQNLSLRTSFLTMGIHFGTHFFIVSSELYLCTGSKELMIVLFHFCTF